MKKNISRWLYAPALALLLLPSLIFAPAQSAIVFADFDEARTPDDAPAELPIDRSDPPDILGTIAREGRRSDLLVVMVFGGRSFVVEDAASALGGLLGLPMVFHLHGGAMPSFMARFPRWTARVGW